LVCQSTQLNTFPKRTLGNEVVDWLTVRTNWVREKCIQFGTLLLKQGFLRSVSPTIPGGFQMKDDGTVYRFTHPSIPNSEESGKISTSPLIINARGQLFTTQHKTLTKIPGCYFSNLLRMTPGEDGIYFIDRNPQLFEDILDYLRDGEIYIPEDDKAKIVLLKREAEFYKIQEIIEKCDKVLQLL